MSCDGTDQLREDCLIAWLLLVHRADVISWAEITYHEQKRAEDRDDDG
jgi:hypothetical protein